MSVRIEVRCSLQDVRCRLRRSREVRRPGLHLLVYSVQVMSFPGSDADATTATAGAGQAGEDEGTIAPGGSVFAVLQAYATHVFAPTVRAYAAARGGDEKARRGEYLFGVSAPVHEPLTKAVNVDGKFPCTRAAL